MVTIGDLEIDATIKQDHSAEAEVTEHPVEQGADPSDHIRRRADTLTLDCLVSSTPLNNTDSVPAGLSTRVMDAYAYLRKAQDEGRLLQVTTVLRPYTNMVITSLRPSRDTHTGDALSIQVQLKQIRVVTNLIEKPTKDLRGQGLKKIRKQPTKPAEAPAESVLFDIFGGKKTFGETR